MACRDLKRAEQAAKDIRKEAKVSDDKVVVEVMDLSSFKSVRAFAERINARKIFKFEIQINVSDA